MDKTDMLKIRIAGRPDGRVMLWYSREGLRAACSLALAYPYDVYVEVCDAGGRALCRFRADADGAWRFAVGETLYHGLMRAPVDGPFEWRGCDGTHVAMSGEDAAYMSCRCGTSRATRYPRRGPSPMRLNGRAPAADPWVLLGRSLSPTRYI